jgi:hypothetical protein
MIFNLKFYTQMEYDGKNMCEFVLDFFWILLVHVHDICTDVHVICSQEILSLNFYCFEYIPSERASGGTIII